MNIYDMIKDKIRQEKAKREQEYFERVKLVARENIQPTHGEYGSYMGMGVQGYTIRGISGVVYLKDCDVAKARQDFEGETSQYHS